MEGQSWCRYTLAALQRPVQACSGRGRPHWAPAPWHWGLTGFKGVVHFVWSSLYNDLGWVLFILDLPLHDRGSCDSTTFAVQRLVLCYHSHPYDSRNMFC